MFNSSEKVNAIYHIIFKNNLLKPCIVFLSTRGMHSLHAMFC